MTLLEPRILESLQAQHHHNHQPQDMLNDKLCELDQAREAVLSQKGVSQEKNSSCIITFCKNTYCTTRRCNQLKSNYWKKHPQSQYPTQVQRSLQWILLKLKSYGVHPRI